MSQDRHDTAGLRTQQPRKLARERRKGKGRGCPLKQSLLHGWTPVFVLSALVAVAVLVAGVRGSAQEAVLALIIGGLVAYIVRHRMRVRQIYDRHAETPKG